LIYVGFGLCGGYVSFGHGHGGLERWECSN